MDLLEDTAVFFAEANASNEQSLNEQYGYVVVCVKNRFSSHERANNTLAFLKLHAEYYTLASSVAFHPLGWGFLLLHTGLAIKNFLDEGN